MAYTLAPEVTAQAGCKDTGAHAVFVCKFAASRIAAAVMVQVGRTPARHFRLLTYSERRGSGGRHLSRSVPELRMLTMSTVISGIADLQLQTQPGRLPLPSHAGGGQVKAQPAPVQESTPSPERVLQEAITAAARQHYPEKNVGVSNVTDQDSGRVVVRVMDRDSGRVLQQSPSEDLLRFFASSSKVDGPLVKMNA